MRASSALDPWRRANRDRIVGNSGQHRNALEALRAAPGAGRKLSISHPFKLAARSCAEGTVLDLGKGVTIGGPRSLSRRDRAPSNPPSESKTSPPAWQRRSKTCCVAARSSPVRSPYSFQGLGEEETESCFAQRRAKERSARSSREVMDPVANRSNAALCGRDASKWARAICRTTTYCGRLVKRADPCCSNAACPPRSKSLLSAEYIMSGGITK